MKYVNFSDVLIFIKMLTAYRGFDALFHSTAGYIAKCSTVMSDMYALKAIELIGKSLAKAVNNGADLDAREDVALANTLSGMVESASGCTSEHSPEHALSACFPELPHGAEQMKKNLFCALHFFCCIYVQLWCIIRLEIYAVPFMSGGRLNEENFVTHYCNIADAVCHYRV